MTIFYLKVFVELKENCDFRNKKNKLVWWIN